MAGLSNVRLDTTDFGSWAAVEGAFNKQDHTVGRRQDILRCATERTPRNTPFVRGGAVMPWCCRRWGSSDGSVRFFDLDERYQRLSENGDPLVKLAALIDFEAFRPKLAIALQRSDGSKVGRPPYDPALMFRIQIPQTLDTLSDDATEFQIRDRLSFMRFLGLGFEDALSDAKTVWLFREHPTQAGAIEELFAALEAWLKCKGYLAMSGQIIDASIIAAPRQCNTDAGKADLKEGRDPRGMGGQAEEARAR